MIVVVVILVVVVDVVVDDFVVVDVVESVVPLSSKFVVMARFKTKIFATIETASRSIRLDAK